VFLRATKTWDELARAIIQDILEEHGGLVALLPFLCLFLLFIVIGVSWFLLSRKQKEMDRMADSKAKLEGMVLGKRISTKSKGPRS